MDCKRPQCPTAIGSEHGDPSNDVNPTAFVGACRTTVLLARFAEDLVRATEL